MCKLLFFLFLINGSFIMTYIIFHWPLFDHLFNLIFEFLFQNFWFRTSHRTYFENWSFFFNKKYWLTLWLSLIGRLIYHHNQQLSLLNFKKKKVFLQVFNVQLVILIWYIYLLLLINKLLNCIQYAPFLTIIEMCTPIIKTIEQI